MSFSDNFELHDDQVLISQAQTGCNLAFGELDRRYRVRLTTFVRMRLGTSATFIDEDDVVQESFIKAWRAIADFDICKRFSTWLFTIAQHTLVDHLRRQRRSTQHKTLDNHVGVSSCCPERDLLNAEAAEQLWSLASKLLSTDQLSVTWLRYGEDLAVGEIAAILHRSPISVRVTLHRARRVLHNHLSHPSYQEGNAAAAEEKSYDD
ncbi:MAG: sigma-70 family RNA polymerase sigma factor [Planctomycetales bacterium]|nr:sigma-70 family RNA polymerase sigma factor [Planctomycetales bacterium]